MWKVLFRARESFARDQRGNVAILFAFTAVPLIALLGGAVDVTRHQRHKMEILNAMDAATIALVAPGRADRRGSRQVRRRFHRRPWSTARTTRCCTWRSFDATKIEGGYRVSSNGYMDTAFLPVVGMARCRSTSDRGDGEHRQVRDRARARQHRLDGRSHGRIEALRDAAAQLVDDLYKEPGTEDRVKMALVPFVTTVNVKSTTADVFQTCRGSIMSALAGYRRQDGLWLQLSADPKAKPVAARRSSSRCASPGKGAWRRAPSEDEDDNAPTDTAATRWVPYLWPDEPDGRGYGNSYLTDVTTAGTGTTGTCCATPPNMRFRPGTKVSDTYDARVPTRPARVRSSR